MNPIGFPANLVSGDIKMKKINRDEPDWISRQPCVGGYKNEKN